MRHQRRWKRSKQRDQGTIEMNLAAMLDMAFQLLTFFILTFRPAPIEGQLALNLPPPVAQTNVESSVTSLDGASDVLSVETLHLHASSDQQGDLRQLKVESDVVIQGQLDAESLQRLDASLQSRFALQNAGFDRIQIAVDGRLRYGELMRIIDVCHHQKLPDGSLMQRISFTEISSNQAKETE